MKSGKITLNTMQKIKYVNGWDNRKQKRKYKEAVIVNYLLNEVVEAQTKDGKKIYLYKHEYYTI